MSFFKAAKLLLTLHCEESTRLMSDGLERDLSAVERWAVRLHFISCKACRRFRKQLQFLQAAAQRHTERCQDAKLPPQVRDQIRRGLRP